MKRRLNVFIRIFYLLPPIILLFGCVTTPRAPMETPVQNLSQIAQNEGIIVGSVLVMGPKTIFGTRPRCWLTAKHDSERGDPYAKEYSLETVWEEEKIFVTKMPAGDYYFKAHHYGKSKAYLNLLFTVHPEKTVYLGRLVIEYFGRHLLAGGMEYRYTVEDAKEQTLTAAEKTYGGLVRNALTDFMDKIKIPNTIEKVNYQFVEKGKFCFICPSGPLTFNKDSFEYRSKKIQLTVPYASILDVKVGRIGMDFANDYVIIKYRIGGIEKFAAFLGTYRGTIYKTFNKVYLDYGTSEGK